MQEITNRFLPPQIPEARWGKYLGGKRMHGIMDPAFVGRINGTMICLTCAIIRHTLQAGQIPIYKHKGDFSPEAAGREPEPLPFTCPRRQI